MPGMTIGGLLGRLVGQLAFQHDLIEGRQRGTFALIGTAAVLGGMTRMTLTLSVILAELTNDVALLPALMFTLAISRAVGDALNHSFDDMMIHIQGLPYLEEEVPQELEVLAARDVMSALVVQLPEKVRVAQLLATLRQSPHNGFPIVGSKLETMHFTCGLILRQQLEVSRLIVSSAMVSSVIVSGVNGKWHYAYHAYHAYHGPTYYGTTYYGTTYHGITYSLILELKLWHYLLWHYLPWHYLLGHPRAQAVGPQGGQGYPSLRGGAPPVHRRHYHGGHPYAARSAQGAPRIHPLPILLWLEGQR